MAETPTPVPHSRRTPLLPRWASGPSPGPPDRTLPVHGVPVLGRLILGGIAIGLLWMGWRTLEPVSGPLILAAWMAHLLRPWYRRVVRWTKGSDRAAAVITMGLVIALLAPIAGAATTLISGGRDLVALIMKSEGGKGALQALVSGGGGGARPTLANLPNLLKEYGASAYTTLQSVATISAEMFIALFIFYAAFFAMLVSGHTQHAWALRHAPIGPRPVTRLVRAFHEAGRGLLVGTGLTALVQGALATIAYFALGVPRALVLGLFTMVAALIPSVGTALIWVPVAAGLALTGSVAKAIILATIGLTVIGLSDNILRPVLAHTAHLELNATLTLVAMLSGISAFGAFGLFLGPLILRLAAEALAIAREADVFARRNAAVGVPGGELVKPEPDGSG